MRTNIDSIIVGKRSPSYEVFCEDNVFCGLSRWHLCDGNFGWVLVLSHVGTYIIQGKRKAKPKEEDIS